MRSDDVVMSDYMPIWIPYRAWRVLAGTVLIIWVPLCSLLAVLLFRSAPLPSGWIAGAALFLAALGTTLQVWHDARTAAVRLMEEPQRWQETWNEMKSASLVWGLLCTAAWTGLFAQVLR